MMDARGQRGEQAAPPAEKMGGQAWPPARAAAIQAAALAGMGQTLTPTRHARVTNREARTARAVSPTRAYGRLSGLLVVG